MLRLAAELPDIDPVSIEFSIESAPFGLSHLPLFQPGREVAIDAAITAELAYSSDEY